MTMTQRELIFFDTETTDLRPGEIAQLSYIVTNEALEPVKARNFYFTVDKMAEGAQRVNGLSAELLLELSSGKKFVDYHQEIHQDFSQRLLVAHNLRFDVTFLQSEFLRCGINFSNSECLCTMNYFKGICRIPDSKGKVKNPKLEEVLRYFAITDEEVGASAIEAYGDLDFKYHDSRIDAIAVYLIYKKAAEAGHIQKSIG